MAQVNFHVRSNRISQFEVDAPKTVAQIRTMLAASGFDVEEARVSVVRPGGEVLIGQLCSIIPGPFDIVRFNTTTVNMPIAEKKLRELVEANNARFNGGCPCNAKAQNHGEVKVGGLTLTVEAEDDKTVVIRFRA